ncbi:MAG: IS1634 family transposase [Solirubrobacterales bacterium]|nr:IS1634 family transposase [Solirubrobacterales bacterium]
MFVREKHINGYTYLYLVESVRENGRAKQRIIKNLGRKETVVASGDLERLASSVARYAERAVVLSQLAAGNPDQLACKRIGAPLLFGRLWEETGCQAVIEDRLAGRGFEFAVERAVFATVLHRLLVSGSDRSCERWMSDYAIPGVDGLMLHQLYRAMAWLGEELPAEEQSGATPFAPRCVKDQVEEGLFARRRDLFAELSVVFLDTTSLSFAGAGGESLGERGYSKDHRPDLMQMIVGVVIDAEGRPVCSELWPGNTADVGALIPIIDRLRSRFAIGRICIVADRGMISAATLAALEARDLEYVLGARERTERLIRTVVLADGRAYTPLCVRRSGGEETQLWVKEVKVEGRRYIVCRNEAEAARDAADRRAIVAALDRQLRRGDKALIGNSAYRRYLRATTDQRAFEIDPGKLADEARYDGIFVLRTNARLTPLQAALRYRDLMHVEALFKTAKSLLRTRPIYHVSDAAIRGHVFCSFLALVLRKELDTRCQAAGIRPEWGEVLRDLDRLQEVAFSKGGQSITLRTPATGVVGPLFKAARIALPPNIRDDSRAA